MSVICVKENGVTKFNGKTENVEHPPRSSDLTPLEFFLWGAPQNHVNCMT
jgi:hypothetical protein